jgi:hypothetical protein
MSEQFVDAFEHEVAEEKAEALGRTGNRLQHAVELLRAHDRASSAAPAKRERLLWDAAARAEAFIVQREACGLRDTSYVLAFYDVPHEVIARVGAKRPDRLS